MEWSGSSTRSIKQKLIIFFSAWIIGVIMTTIIELMGLPRRSAISLGPLPFDQLTDELPGIIWFNFYFSLVIVWFDSIGRKSNNFTQSKERKNFRK